MKPYYQDDAVTLYHGRCEDVLPTLSLTGSVHLLTDPPYFKVKDNDWDNQWSKSAEFLDWMGDWLDLAKPHLSPDASVWVFASPELTSAVESVVASRFRVLNSVRWVKQTGYHMKASLSGMRAYRPAWEGIIFAEQLTDAYLAQDYLSHKATFLRVGNHLRKAREETGISRRDLGAALVEAGIYNSLASANANISLQEIGSDMISQRSHAVWSKLIPIRDFAALRAEYADLRVEHEQSREGYQGIRRPFDVSRRDRSTDIFDFPGTPVFEGRHPCEKPAELLAHMIETTTRPGDTIIDCFAGSGAVLDVARQLGRKAVGIEMDAHWCRQISKRLSQQAFDLGDIA